MSTTHCRTEYGQYVAGEWRTATTHEYTVYADASGNWSGASVVEYGEWNEYTEDEARDYFPADVIAEVDAILKGGN